MAIALSSEEFGLLYTHELTGDNDLAVRVGYQCGAEESDSHLGDPGFKPRPIPHVILERATLTVSLIM
jgi:hypothetical protein